MSEINLRPDISQVYGEIIATPYYQDGDIYRYAKHLIMDGDTSSILEIKAIIDDEDRDDQNDLIESYQIILDALSQLDEIAIPKSDYEAWVMQRIKSDQMVNYVDILDNLFAQLALIAYKHGHWQATETELPVEEGWMDYTYYAGQRAMLIDYRMLDDKNEAPANASDYVLNRKNPFADVSIKNQRFIYASDYDRFNALELRTSRKITKVDKDEERSFVTLQPGFNIRNSPKVEGGATSNIRFDDTLTTELTQNDDKTYIYLDARGLSSE